MENGGIKNFLIKSIRILVEITRILINIIIMVKIRILVDFTRNIVSARISIISIRISNKFHQKFLPV